MRTNLVMRLNCSECGRQLNLKLEKESANPVEISGHNENPKIPTGAACLHAGLIMVEPCRFCIEKYTGPSKRLLEALNSLQEN